MLEFSFMKYKLDTRGFWLRKASEKRVDGYVKSHAPEKYLDILQRDYPLGCKRVIPDPGYLSSLHDPKMNLLKDPVESVTATEVITKSGARYDVDVIILATGFVGGGGSINVVGKSGTPLRQRLRTTMGYKSISLVDFPNFFLGYGPNAVPAHSSAITAIENIAHLMIKVANPVIRGGRDEVEVEKKYEEEWNASTQAELKDHVWQNCNSFFRDETGRNNFTCPWNSYGMFFEMWWPDMKAWRYT
jgi:cation diffusion facilitator CzcD-associated flavoprotein CzcO